MGWDKGRLDSHVPARHSSRGFCRSTAETNAKVARTWDRRL